MKKNKLYLLGTVVFLIGFLVMLYPVIREKMADGHSQRVIRDFEQERHKSEQKGHKSQQERQQTQANAEVGETESADRGKTESYESLLKNMQDYNQAIFEQGQQGLCDPWTSEDRLFELSGTGLEDDMIGYLTIDAMDIKIPLYIGASAEHMVTGAAVLNETSMPVGGTNTNCVIAAHRGGYNGTAMFRDIEALKPGDQVVIDNLWETLTYQVVKCIVITPDDLEAVKIFPGKELVTLVTCHPYTHNYQRYVVYCRRVTDQESDVALTLEREAAELPDSDVVFEGSSEAISREKNMRYLGIAGAAVLLAAVAAAAFVRRHQLKK